MGFVIASSVLGAIFAFAGVRSLVSWMRRDFDAETFGEHVVFALHVTARVGLWFALALAFVGTAFVDEPQRFRWYAMVPISLAVIQVLTALYLGRGVTPESGGNGRAMRGEDTTPGPLQEEKTGESADPTLPQPEAAEVESARLLENQARERLAGKGYSDDDIRRLADEYIALDRGEDLDAFVEWVRQRGTP